MGTHPIFESDFDCLTAKNQNGAFSIQLSNRPIVVFHPCVFSYDRWTRIFGLLFRRASNKVQKRPLSIKGLFPRARFCHLHGSWNDVHHAHCWNLCLDQLLSSFWTSAIRRKMIFHLLQVTPVCFAVLETNFSN